MSHTADKAPLVSIVIVNWNGASLLPACLESIHAQSYKHYEIIVVDNASTDKSVALLRRKYPKVKLIENATNLGFAGGVNVGAVLAQGTYMALLNTDAVADPQWLEGLVASLQKNARRAVATPKVLLPPPPGRSAIRLESAGDCLTVWGVARPRGREELDKGQYDNQVNVMLASGSSSLYRLNTWRDLGGFDERFFMYYEDVDYSLRARQAGHDIVYAPLAMVTHQPGTSSKKRGHLSRYYILRNSHLVYWKNLSNGLAWRLLPRFIVAQIYMMAGALKAGAIIPLFKAEISGIARAIPYIVTPRHLKRPLSYSDLDQQWPFERRLHS